MESPLKNPTNSAMMNTKDKAKQVINLEKENKHSCISAISTRMFHACTNWASLDAYSWLPGKAAVETHATTF